MRRVIMADKRALPPWLRLLVMCVVISILLYPPRGVARTDTVAKDLKSFANDDVISIPFPIEWKKYDKYPWDILKIPEFRKSYFSLLGHKMNQKWLKTLSGPSSPAIVVQSSQQKFLVLNSCKQNHCDDYYILILFSPARNEGWALVHEGGLTSWLGDVDVERKHLLRKLERLIWPSPPPK
jgi:hypothetical protein